MSQVALTGTNTLANFLIRALILVLIRTLRNSFSEIKFGKGKSQRERELETIFSILGSVYCDIKQKIFAFACFKFQRYHFAL